MLHSDVVRCMLYVALYVACCRVAHCTLDAAQCVLHLRSCGDFYRNAAVGIARVACCMLYAACRNGQRVDVRCMKRIVRCASHL